MMGQLRKQKKRHSKIIPKRLKNALKNWERQSLNNEVDLSIDLSEERWARLAQ